MPLFRPKSTFVPHVSKPSAETFCRVVEQEILETFQTMPYSPQNNLGQEERNSIKELAYDDIVIKPADMGRALVILNSTDYVAEAYHQLNDGQLYKKLNNNPTADFQKIISDITTQALEQNDNQT